MKKIITIITIILIFIPNISYWAKINPFDVLKWNTDNICNSLWKKISYFWDKKSCEWYTQEDIPTIFIPWILASWYSQQWYWETQVKRWIPDPITHSYDTLFYTFKKNWYRRWTSFGNKNISLFFTTTGFT